MQTKSTERHPQSLTESTEKSRFQESRFSANVLVYDVREKQHLPRIQGNFCLFNTGLCYSHDGWVQLHSSVADREKLYWNDMHRQTMKWSDWKEKHQNLITLDGDTIHPRYKPRSKWKQKSTSSIKPSYVSCQHIGVTKSTCKMDKSTLTSLSATTNYYNTILLQLYKIIRFVVACGDIR